MASEAFEILTVKVSPEEKAHLRQMAERRGVTMTDYVRLALKHWNGKTDEKRSAARP